jgi:hypothetical protein
MPLIVRLGVDEHVALNLLEDGAVGPWRWAAVAVGAEPAARGGGVFQALHRRSVVLLVPKAGYQLLAALPHVLA